MSSEGDVRVQAESEPMMTITVRQRDSYLYMIKALKCETEMLRAEIAGLRNELGAGNMKGT